VRLIHTAQLIFHEGDAGGIDVGADVPHEVDEPNYGASERAARFGDLRDPNQYDRIAADVTDARPHEWGEAPPSRPVAPPGVGRFPRNHLQSVGEIIGEPFDAGNRNRGSHSHVPVGADVPAGDMNPWDLHGNTWRLDPQPWDAELVEGMDSVRHG
jgi:hypothetical protein